MIARSKYMSAIDHSLILYASEAALEMHLGSAEELCEAVRRAMELCMAQGLPLKGNFRRVCKASSKGTVHDWKLSEVAYKMVMFCGKEAVK